MKRVLVVALPEPGHILPSLPLARRLVGLGHQVTYFTSTAFQQPLQSQGLLTTLYSPQKASAPSVTPLYAVPESGRRIWFREVREAIEGKGPFLIRLLQVADELRPDLILLDRVLSRGPHEIGLRLGQRWRLHCFSTSLPSWDDTQEPEGMVFCPAELEVPEFRDRWARLCYVEAGLDFDRQECSVDISDEVWDKPVILCTFGTQSALHRHKSSLLSLLTAAATRLPEYNFIVANRLRADTPQSENPLWPRNLWLRSFLPQLTWLKRAALLISHGGLGSLKESLALGVPSIVLPQLFDQPYNAMRVRHIGIGESIFPPQLTAESLVASIRRTLQERRYNTRIKELQAIVLEREAVAPSMSVVLKLLLESKE